MRETETGWFVHSYLGPVLFFWGMQYWHFFLLEENHCLDLCLIMPLDKDRPWPNWEQLPMLLWFPLQMFFVMNVTLVQSISHVQIPGSICKEVGLWKPSGSLACKGEGNSTPFAMVKISSAAACTRIRRKALEDSLLIALLLCSAWHQIWHQIDRCQRNIEWGGSHCRSIMVLRVGAN